MIIRELYSFLGFELDQAGAEKADAMYQSLKRTALGVSAAFAAVGAALGYAAKDAAASGLELDLWSRRLGIGVERLSALQYAADVSAASGEKLLEALTDLGEKASDVFRNDPKGTSDAGESFKALGISVRTASGALKTVDQLFSEVLDKLPLIQDEGDRTGVAMRLFGDDVGRDLVPFLSLGRDAIEAMAEEAGLLGIVIGESSVGAAKEYSGELAKLGAQLKGIERRIGFGLLPTLTEYAKLANELVKENRDLIRTRLEYWIANITKAALAFADRAQSWLRALDAVFVQTGLLTTVVKGLAVALGVYLIHQLGLAVISMSIMASAAATSTAAMGSSLLATVAAAVKANGIMGAFRAILASTAVHAFLVGLAFAAMGLFVDDVITHIQGGKSIIGEFLEAFDPERVTPEDHWLTRLISSAIGLVQELTRIASDAFSYFTESGEIAAAAGERIDKTIRNLRGLGEAGVSIGMDWAEDAMNWALGANPSGAEASGGSPGSLPFSSASAPSVPTPMAPGGSQLSFQNQVSVTVNGSADPSTVDQIRRATEEAVDRAARSSARQMETSVVR